MSELARERGEGEANRSYRHTDGRRSGLGGTDEDSSLHPYFGSVAMGYMGYMGHSSMSKYSKVWFYLLRVASPALSLRGSSLSYTMLVNLCNGGHVFM